MRFSRVILVLALAVLFMGAATQLNVVTQLKGILAVVNGGTGSANTTAALTPGTTVSVDFSNTARIYTLVPAQTETINATNCATGLQKNLQITTSGVSSFTLTFSTNFKTTGTLATGTTTAKVFNVTFLCNSTTAYEIARTGAE
jgi:FtsP/CotA-like multicopper oxidase with cupredoxin domain